MREVESFVIQGQTGRKKEGIQSKRRDKKQNAVENQACRKVVRTKLTTGDYSVFKKVGSAAFCATSRERRPQVHGNVDKGWNAIRREIRAEEGCVTTNKRD